MASQTDKRSGNSICSFCGKGQEEGRTLIPGPTVYICEECMSQAVNLCNDSISEE